MISLAGLNDSQRSAAEKIEGPLLILAGAGSGKTRTITYRMAHMISNYAIPAKEILGVSFTNKAAKEMRERMSALLGKRMMRGLTLSTFHSLGVRILRKEIEKLGYHKNFTIYDQSEQIAIVRGALKNYKAEKKFDQKAILSTIGKLKNLGIDPDDYVTGPYFRADDPFSLATEYVYRDYQDKLTFFNAIDFDDILFLTVKLMRQNPDVAKAYSEKYRYIMIDEYQDTNDLQFELIRALTSTHQNICVVGDDDQAIYSFRGANIQNILNFEHQFPGAAVVKLEENYRSTSPILNLANRVIGENKERKEKTLWSRKQSEVKPLVWSMGSTDHEAETVVETIVQHQAGGGHLGDIAILYRSNTQAPPFEEQLRMSQVPYTMLGGQKFYEKKEVKDLMAYLACVHNEKDQLSLRRILNIPNRGIGTKTLQKFLRAADLEKIDLYHAMEKYPELAERQEAKIREFLVLMEETRKNFELYPLTEAIDLLIQKINYYGFIEKQYEQLGQVERRKNDIQHFLDSAERFQKYFGKNATLQAFVEKVLLQDNQDDQNDEEDDDVRKNEVTMMTLHSSKGLEFRKVFLVGMEEELLPHKKTITMGEDISEERRLAYVGVTRAQEELIMTYCKERKIYGKNVQRHPSRFIHELEKEGFLIEQDRTNFGHLTEEEAETYKKNFFSNLIDQLD